MQVPIERLMIETDSPYMAPEPFRGRRNSSLYVTFADGRKTIAEIKGISAAEVERITTENGQTAVWYFRVSRKQKQGQEVKSLVPRFVWWRRWGSNP